MSVVASIADILRVLETSRELSVTALADRLGQPKSTTSRMLKEMARTGFLTQNAQSRRYTPGPLLLSAGRQYKASIGLIDRAEAELELLVQRFGHAGFILGLERGYVMILRRVPGTRPVRVEIDDRYAGGLAFYRSGGRALLARLSDEEVTALYSTSLKPPSPNAPQDLPILLAMLAEIRTRGFAESYDEAVPEVGGISVAVGSHDEEAVALNISFPARLVPQDGRAVIADALTAIARSWPGSNPSSI